jgi:hypothetical protein
METVAQPGAVLRLYGQLADNRATLSLWRERD